MVDNARLDRGHRCGRRCGRCRRGGCRRRLCLVLPYFKAEEPVPSRLRCLCRPRLLSRNRSPKSSLWNQTCWQSRLKWRRHRRFSTSCGSTPKGPHWSRESHLRGRGWLWGLLAWGSIARPLAVTGDLWRGLMSAIRHPRSLQLSVVVLDAGPTVRTNRPCGAFWCRDTCCGGGCGTGIAIDKHQLGDRFDHSARKCICARCCADGTFFGDCGADGVRPLQPARAPAAPTVQLRAM